MDDADLHGFQYEQRWAERQAQWREDDGEEDEDESDGEGRADDREPE